MSNILIINFVISHEGEKILFRFSQKFYETRSYDWECHNICVYVYNLQSTRMLWFQNEGKTDNKSSKKLAT